MADRFTTEVQKRELHVIRRATHIQRQTHARMCRHARNGGRADRRTPLCARQDRQTDAQADAHEGAQVPASHPPCRRLLPTYYLYLSIYLSIYLPIYRLSSTYPTIHSSMYPLICLSIICLSTTYRPIHPSSSNCMGIHTVTYTEEHTPQVPKCHVF